MQNNQYTKKDFKWCGKYVGISARRHYNIQKHYHELKMTKRDWIDLAKYLDDTKMLQAQCVYEHLLRLKEEEENEC